MPFAAPSTGKKTTMRSLVAIESPLATTFENLADTIDAFLEAVKLETFLPYIHD